MEQMPQIKYPQRIKKYLSIVITLGGILGGISSGQDIVFRYIVKPTSSVLSEKNTISKNLKNTKIRTVGRHDPCVGIRAVPVGIAMTNFVLADLILMNHSKLF